MVSRTRHPGPGMWDSASMREPATGGWQRESRRVAATLLRLLGFRHLKMNQRPGGRSARGQWRARAQWMSHRPSGARHHDRAQAGQLRILRASGTIVTMTARKRVNWLAPFEDIRRRCHGITDSQATPHEKMALRVQRRSYRQIDCFAHIYIRQVLSSFVCVFSVYGMAKHCGYRRGLGT